MQRRGTRVGYILASLMLSCSGGALDDFEDDQQGSSSGGQASGGASLASGGSLEGMSNSGGLGSGGAGAGGAIVEGSGGSFTGGEGGNPDSSGSGGEPLEGGVTGAGGAASGGAASGGAASGGAASASGGADPAGTGGQPNPGSGGGENGDECPFSGQIEYQFNEPETWPEDVLERLSNVVPEAVWYYNCYADLSHNLTINYKPGVQTAEGNVDGWISFGTSPGYQVLATTMHEIAHTMGVGYFPWSELAEDGRWVGAHVVQFMTSLPASQKDSDMYSQRDYITIDNQHFWPYGLNQASEHQSEWSLINHVRIVAAMQRDKEDYLSGQ